MNPEHLMCFTGTLHYVTDTGTEDRYGDPAEEETTATTRFWLHQTTETETTGLDNTQTADADLWLPAATTPDGLTRLTGLGKTWDLVGPPVAAYNARTGVLSHWEARARVTT